MFIATISPKWRWKEYGTKQLEDFKNHSRNKFILGSHIHVNFLFRGGQTITLKQLWTQKKHWSLMGLATCSHVVPSIAPQYIPNQFNSYNQLTQVFG